MTRHAWLDRSASTTAQSSNIVSMEGEDEAPVAPPNDQAFNDNTASVSIFERLSAIADEEAFLAVFCENLPRIYEYDKREIIEFLQGADGRRATHPLKDTLLSIRLQLYVKLCTLFPEYDNLEMYNAEDIYIIGYSTVNQLKDRRLSKVMKPGGATNATNANDVSLVESGDLIETCMSLRGTVTVLTTAVANFTNELITLREKVSQLEMRLGHGVGIPAQVAMDGNNTQQAAVHHTSTTELADPDTGIQPPSGDTGVQAEANVVAVPPEEPSQPVAVTTEDNAMNGENEDGENGDNDFRLPGHQRRRVIRGFKLQSSNRTIINGSPSANFKVKGARSDDTRLLHSLRGQT